MTIDVKRNGAVIEQLPLNENAKYTNKLMGENSITLSVSTDRKLNVKPLDYIEWWGVRYTLWDDPNDGVVDGGVVDYDCVFFAPYYNLYNIKLKDEGSAKFQYNGYTRDFLNLLIRNMNEVDSGWTLAAVEDTEFVRIDFNDNSCFTALVKVCEQLKLEFDIQNKIISVKKRIGQNTEHTFSYGKGNGLYEITRDKLANNAVITVLEVFGGTTNMPVTGKEEDKRLRLTAPLEQNVALYGRREGSVTFDHIFPRLKDKTVTGVIVPADIDKATEWEVALGIDFDLGGKLLPGITPQIQFQSGTLKGVTFDLAAAKGNQFRIYWVNGRCKIVVKEEGDSRLPSVNRQPKAGDQFVLLNVSMDASYKTEALAELEREGNDYLSTVCATQFVYTVKPDPRYIKAKNITLNVGDKVRITDQKLGIDTLIRTSIISCPLVAPNEIELTISDDVLYSADEKIKVNIEQTSQQVSVHSDDIRYQYLMLEKNTARLNANSKEIEIQKQEILNASKEILRAELVENQYRVKGGISISTSDFYATGQGGTPVPPPTPGSDYAIIKDNEVSASTAWSSAKVASYFDGYVQNNDPRLSDPRPASDVYGWAKQPTPPAVDSAKDLRSESTIRYNTDRLQYFNIADGGDGKNGNVAENPYGSTQWAHNIVLNLPNTEGYYTQISTPVGLDDIKFRRMEGGTFRGWQTLYHSGNVNNYNADWNCKGLKTKGRASIGEQTNGNVEINAYNGNAYFGCNNAENGLYVNPNGTTYAKQLIVNPTNVGPGNYDEGLRLVKHSNGWSNIHLGTDTSVKGFVSGQWLIGKKPDNQFIISYAGNENGNNNLRITYDGTAYVKDIIALG